jgi:hypothetical protein
MQEGASAAVTAVSRHAGGGVQLLLVPMALMLWLNLII